MAQMQNAQTIALQLEKVRDKVPLLYERDDVLLTMIQQRGDVEKVSSRNMRLPLQLIPGGKAGSLQRRRRRPGARLGHHVRRGAGLADLLPVRGGNHASSSSTPRNAREKAIENAVKREVANGMKQFRAFLDKVIQTAGNGVLGTISAVSGTTFTMTMPSGAALVYVGQTIQMYDTTLTTNRGSCNVVSRRSDQPDANHHRGLVAGRNRRHRRDRARRTFAARSRFRSTASSITRTTRPPARGST